MRTLIRAVCTVGGVALLAPAAPAQHTHEGPGLNVPVGQVAQIDGGPGQAPPGRPPLRRGGPPPQSVPWTEDKFSRTVPIGARNSFELSNLAGDITITGVEGERVRISAIRRVREPNVEAARALLQNITIRIMERGGGVEVLTEVPGGRIPPIVVDYAVSLPTTADITLRTLRGVIRVDNVKGELRAESFLGDMALSSVGTVKSAKALGNLTISGAEGDELNGTTLSSGTLLVRNVHARTMELRSFGGHILLSAVQCDRCTVNSVSGNIEFTGVLRRDARYNLNSNSGDIRLITPGTVGFNLDAMTGGTIRNEFALRPASGPPPASERILRGSYGDGSAILSLRSFTGAVSVVKE
jgi:hypothetical protein